MIQNLPYQFFKSISSNLTQTPSLTLYKIFGQQQFSFQKAQYQSKVDWSGFYTQLQPQHSMRYLTKKWDDGATMACLMKLSIINTNLKLLTVQHQEFANPKIPGQIKAQNIKKHLKLQYPQFEDIQSFKLLYYLGKQNVLLSCIDSQEPEIIIPHQLLNSNNFSYQIIANFKRSNDGMLRTVEFKKKQWRKVPVSAQFQPYLLLGQNIWNSQQ